LSAITRYLERKIDEHSIVGLEPKILNKPKSKPKKKFRGLQGKSYGKPTEKNLGAKKASNKKYYQDSNRRKGSVKQNAK
ncbi:MAG: hypothetical protein Q4A74_07005, partial [Cardiobacteriaceae bacterium]|nr:hypothetical protein [Cardiobacteriaceae bacterium]